MTTLTTLTPLTTLPRHVELLNILEKSRPLPYIEAAFNLNEGQLSEIRDMPSVPPEILSLLGTLVKYPWMIHNGNDKEKIKTAQQGIMTAIIDEDSQTP